MKGQYLDLKNNQGPIKGVREREEEESNYDQTERIFFEIFQNFLNMCT